MKGLPINRFGNVLELLGKTFVAYAFECGGGRIGECYYYILGFCEF